MKQNQENIIFQYQFVSKSQSNEKIVFFLDSKATLFASTKSNLPVMKLQELNSDFLNDIKNYINNILESDWEREYKGKLKNEGGIEFTEFFTFNNGTKEITIVVENGNRPRILEDYLSFLRHFYPDLSSMLFH